MNMNFSEGPLAAAVRLLSRRDYSEARLRSKLAGEYSPAELDEVISKLKLSGYLNDSRLKLRLLEKLVAEKKHGLLMIKEKLRQSGFDQLTGSELRRYYTESQEWETAVHLLEKRFSPWQSEELPRLSRFLNNRGFSTEIVSKLAQEYRKYQD